jgi:hypothetical protein
MNGILLENKKPQGLATTLKIIRIQIDKIKVEG